MATVKMTSVLLNKNIATGTLYTDSYAVGARQWCKYKACLPKARQ